jgi:hypothetical protein
VRQAANSRAKLPITGSGWPDRLRRPEFLTVQSNIARTVLGPGRFMILYRTVKYR